MTSISNSYTFIAILGALGIFIFGLMLIYSRVFRRNPASIGLALCAALWVCGMGFAKLNGDYSIQIAAFFVQYSSISALIPFLVLTTMGFTGRLFIKRKIIVISFFSISAIFVGLILTSPLTGLVFDHIGRSPNGELLRSSGPLYPVFVFYLFSSVFICMLIIVRRMRALSPQEVRRSRILITAFALPTLAAFLELAGVRPLGNISMIPLAMLGSAITLAWGVLNARLLSPVVLAHESLVDGMTDPILVVDAHSRIVYANRAAKELMPVASFKIGKFLVECLPELENLDSKDLTDDFVIPLGIAKYTIRRLPIANNIPGLAAARLYVLHDVTSMMTARGELEILVSERTARLEEEIERYRYIKTELEETVSEKEMLLQELHHRVKNNLQIIISLLNLQSNRVDEGASLQSVFLAIKSRIRSISLVHEHMHQTRFHDGVDFGEYVIELVHGIANLYEQIPAKLEIRVPQHQFRGSMDFCVDFGLVVNELLTNAFKHGLAPSGGGILQIELLRDGGNAILCVADNGPGFPHLGVNNPRSLGMNIVNALCQKHRTLVETSHGSGGKICLTIPLGPDGISHLSFVNT